MARPSRSRQHDLGSGRNTGPSAPIQADRLASGWRQGAVRLASGWRRVAPSPDKGPHTPISPLDPHDPDQAISVRAEIRAPRDRSKPVLLKCCGLPSLFSSAAPQTGLLRFSHHRRRLPINAKLDAHKIAPTDTMRNRSGPRLKPRPERANFDGPRPGPVSIESQPASPRGCSMCQSLFCLKSMIQAGRPRKNGPGMIVATDSAAPTAQARMSRPVG
jgi:hypothetical protein